MVDPIKLFSIAGTREKYTLLLVNPVTGKTQVAGPKDSLPPKYRRFFGGSFSLAPYQIEKLPLSCLQTESMAKGESGYYAYTARPLTDGGLKVQAPLPEYSHFSVVLYGVDELRDYIATVLKAPLYVPEGGYENYEEDDDEQLQAQ